jgi:hypothetical protein
MNIEYLITQLLAIKSKVDVMLTELEDAKNKSEGKPTWEEEHPIRKEWIE